MCYTGRMNKDAIIQQIRESWEYRRRNPLMMETISYTAKMVAPPIAETGNIHTIMVDKVWWNSVVIGGRRYLLRRLGGPLQAFRP